MRPAEVAALLRVDKRTLQRMADRGDIPVVKLPGSNHRRYRRDAIEAILGGQE